MAAAPPGDKTLRALLHTRGRFSYDDAARAILLLAEALEVAHAAGGFHPTLRLEDVALDDSKARILAPAANVGDVATDVLALGRVAWELVVGSPVPASGDGRAPRPSAALGALVPSVLDELIVACLDPVAARRPTSAADVNVRLSRTLTPGMAMPLVQHPGPALPTASLASPQLTPPVEAPFPTIPRWGPALLVAVAVLIAGAMLWAAAR